MDETEKRISEAVRAVQGGFLQGKYDCRALGHVFQWDPRGYVQCMYCPAGGPDIDNWREPT